MSNNRGFLNNILSKIAGTNVQATAAAAVVNNNNDDNGNDNNNGAGGGGEATAAAAVANNNNDDNGKNNSNSNNNNNNNNNDKSNESAGQNTNKNAPIKYENCCAGIEFCGFAKDEVLDGLKLNALNFGFGDLKKPKHCYSVCKKQLHGALCETFRC